MHVWHCEICNRKLGQGFGEQHSISTSSSLTRGFILILWYYFTAVRLEVLPRQCQIKYGSVMSEKKITCHLFCSLLFLPLHGVASGSMDFFMCAVLYCTSQLGTSDPKGLKHDIFTCKFLCSFVMLMKSRPQNLISCPWLCMPKTRFSHVHGWFRA
jgi:hypothetical protein